MLDSVLKKLSKCNSKSTVKRLAETIAVVIFQKMIMMETGDKDRDREWHKSNSTQQKF